MTDNVNLTYPGQSDNRTNDEIIESIKAGNTDDIAVLWEKNQGLVRLVIKREIKPPEQDIDDLTQQAFFGFMDSVNRYEIGGKANFATFAYKGIAWSLKRYYLQGGYACCIPDYMKTLIRKYKITCQELESENIFLDDNEIMQRMNITRFEYFGIKRALRYESVLSIDAPMNEESAASKMSDFILSDDDVEGTATDSVYARELHKYMTAALNRLPVIDRQMLMARYYQGYSLEKIADVYGCTRQAVDYHIKYGYQAIRHGRYSRILKEFL